nr:immunoglobulin heavy chain junction region [Mus musculus]
CAREVFITTVFDVW